MPFCEHRIAEITPIRRNDRKPNHRITKARPNGGITADSTPYEAARMKPGDALRYQ
jgi:hypothetical protein